MFAIFIVYKFIQDWQQHLYQRPRTPHFPGKPCSRSQWDINGWWGWEARALSAGIRAYLSQIVELSSSMSIYVLALTWLSYFNDFICQSPVLFTRLTGRMRNFCTPIEINRDCRAAQMCSFPGWFARVSRGTIAFSSLFIY